jgi:hypothetical protein
LVKQIVELFRNKGAIERDRVIILMASAHCLGFGVQRHEVEVAVGEGLQAKR